MNRPMDNVRPLVFPRASRTHWGRDLAKVIPLRSRRRPSPLSRAIALSLGVVIIAALAVAVSVLMLRSERELVTDVGPWWPWYWPPG
jgi:hypothetical protein